MEKTSKKVIVVLFVVILIATLLAACGKQWTCDICGKSFSGKAYYGMDTGDTYCEDCARDYWMPLPYENYVKK